MIFTTISQSLFLASTLTVSHVVMAAPVTNGTRSAIVPLSANPITKVVSVDGIIIPTQANQTKTNRKTNFIEVHNTQIHVPANHTTKYEVPPSAEALTKYDTPKIVLDDKKKKEKIVSNRHVRIPTRQFVKVPLSLHGSRDHKKNMTKDPLEHPRTRGQKTTIPKLSIPNLRPMMAASEVRKGDEQGVEKRDPRHRIEIHGGELSDPHAEHKISTEKKDVVA